MNRVRLKFDFVLEAENTPMRSIPFTSSDMARFIRKLQDMTAATLRKRTKAKAVVAHGGAKLGASLVRGSK